jgi:hypothetical protein
VAPYPVAGLGWVSIPEQRRERSGLSLMVFAATEIDAIQARVLTEHEARLIAINVAVAGDQRGPIV